MAGSEDQVAVHFPFGRVTGACVIIAPLLRIERQQVKQMQPFFPRKKRFEYVAPSCTVEKTDCQEMRNISGGGL